MTLTTHSRKWLSLALVLAAVAVSNGCAALSNPVSDGIPVRYLPKEVLGRSKKELIPIPLTLLKLQESDVYKLDKGDMLAVIAGDLFGPENSQPPVSVPAPGEGTLSAIGYPVPVREDGTISLPNPRIKPINVKGMTTIEVEQLLRDVLTGKEPGQPEIFAKGGAKISVQLMKKRRINVTVVRDDVQSSQGVGTGNIAITNQKRFGVTVSLEAGKNDVLNALNQSGGPPGSDARNEIIIERGVYDPANPRKIESCIPLSIYPDMPLNITPKDITLNDGDIIRIPNRATELYLVGGIINPIQVALPKDYDLDVVQAIIVGHGPIVSGAFIQNGGFNNSQIAAGLGSPSPVLVNVLRQLPDNQQINIRVDLARALKDPRENILILANDRIIMQERPGEAFARYLTQTLRFPFSSKIIQSGNNGTLDFTGSVP